MKTENGNFLRKTGLALWLGLILAGAPQLANGANTQDNALAEATSDLRAAEKQFEQAEKDFTGAGNNQEAAPANNPVQRNGKLPWSDAGSASQSGNSHTMKYSDPRASALQGSPETGYAGTWTDPATGDIITSVIAPRPQTGQNAQNYPIIVEPSVSGGNWGYSDNDYNSGWSGGYPQWPVSPDNPGYGNWPGQTHMPPMGPPMQMPNASNGFQMLPPPLPDNFHPGYRPLRPNHPGQPGWGPHGPKPGWGPGPVMPPWQGGQNGSWGWQGNNNGIPPGWGGNNPGGWHPGFNPGGSMPPGGATPPPGGMNPPPGVTPPSPGETPPQGGMPPNAGRPPALPGIGNPHPAPGGMPGLNPGHPGNPGIWRPGNNGWLGNHRPMHPGGGQWNRPPQVQPRGFGGFGSDHGRTR